MDHVRSTVLQWIDLGKVSPGDQLPPARELAGQLGVSRPMVLQAMKILEAEGRVVVRHGDGTRVAQLAPANVEVRRAHTVQRSDEILQMCALREMIEAGVARRLATDGMPAATLAKARALVDAMRKAVDTPDVYRRLDNEFHELVVDALGMPLVSRAITDARATVALTFDLLEWPEGRRSEGCDDHARLLAAIGARDPEAAEGAAREHLRTAPTLIERTYGTRRRERR